MSIYRTHILFPVDEGTVQSGVLEVKRRLESELKARKLENEIKVLESGSVGLVGKGVILAVYPDRIYYFHVREEDVPRIIEEHLLKGRVVADLDHAPVLASAAAPEKAGARLGLTREQRRIVLDKAWTVDPDNINEVLAAGGYRALEKIFSEKIIPEAVIEEIKGSGLRGRGGAGFPTGMKWEFTRKAAGNEKYVICNADEGDPGAYMDRSLLEGNPHSVLEGMIIGAYAIGVHEGYVYVRNEYPLAVINIGIAIQQAREKGLLGKNILGSGFDFDIKISRGGGAFVCGESSALVASVAGDVGEPRAKHIHSWRAVFGTGPPI